MKNSNKIRLLLPKGSLNTPGRADTNSILKAAGYDITGYEPGKENDQSMRIRNDTEIEVRLARPQSAPNELVEGMADLAIIGSDWVLEEDEENVLEQVIDLEYGKTKIVFAVPNETPGKNLTEFLEWNRETGILCYSEYVKITARAFVQNEAYPKENGDPIIKARGFKQGQNDRVRINMSDGVTEGYLKKGANIIVDNTQTGSTLQSYGARILEEISESSTGLYANKTCMEDSWLANKAQEISAQLKGVIEARKKDYVVFNIPNNKLSETMTYVMNTNLFNNEPTITEGKEFTQVSLLVKRQEWPTVSKQLQKYGARGIMRYEPLQVIGGSSP